MEGMMVIIIPHPLLKNIMDHGEKAYPEEGAGLMLGYEHDGKRYVADLLMVENSREDSARHNRYLISAEDILGGEREAERLGLEIVGIFHSHPDHPNQPSDFDREWAIPWYSYLITSVNGGKALESKCWRLTDDRSRFLPERIESLFPEGDHEQ
jgi:proteasome lid subunit RPN8/RPN11